MTSNKQLLFIGLNGFAGAGKDTVAKMIKTILGHQWNSLEECKEYYNKIYTNPTWTATYHSSSIDSDNKRVLCIAYADQLKMICSAIFGIPFSRFYMNKSTAWVCINDKFQYTEIRPNASQIITADDYYYSYDNYVNTKEQYWMSLRDLLVYIGTYVLQEKINRNIFINIVRNKIKEVKEENPDLEYVVVTDNRFIHEMDYIIENQGITVTIFRNSIEQLENVAEHDLDDFESYDFVINNSGGYDELFEEVWNMIHKNYEFTNTTINLSTRENINNYLRLIGQYENNLVWKVCTPYNIQKIFKDEEIIKMIDLVGGPTIIINEYIDDNPKLFVTHIEYIDNKNQFLVYTQK